MQQIQRDVQELKNLYILSDAVARLDTLDDQKVALTFQVEEALTLFPHVSLGSIEGNQWWQIGFNELNLLGYGVQASGQYRNYDRRHGGQLYLGVPYLFGSTWGASVNLLRWASVEPLYFSEGPVTYDYTNHSIEVLARKEHQIRHRTEGGVNYFVESYEQLPMQELADPPGPQEARVDKLLFKLAHYYNRLDYDFFYVEGVFARLFLERVYNIEDQSIFDLGFVEASYFKRIAEEGNLGIRGVFGLSTNIDSPFAPFVVDSRLNLRGAGNRIDRGTGKLVFNLEYRHTIIDRPLWSSQFVFFCDAGTWRQPGGPWADFWQDENVRTFAGAGLRLIYKKAFNAMLRLDYGIDLQDASMGGPVLGIGQFF
jgi:outer membrane protein assembly factor BamA